MGKLEDTLARLGTSWLSEKLGDSTIQLLDELDFKNLTPGRLAGLLVGLLGNEGILLDEAIRTDLLEALEKPDAVTAAMRRWLLRPLAG